MDHARTTLTKVCVVAGSSPKMLQCSCDQKSSPVLALSRPAPGVAQLFGLGQIGCGAAQLLFRPLLVGDVDRGGKIDRRTCFIAGDGRDERIDADRCPVLAPVSRHDFVVAPLSFPKLIKAIVAGSTLRLRQNIDGERFGSSSPDVAQHGLQRLVGRDEFQVVVGQRNTQCRDFEHRAPSLLAARSAASERLRTQMSPRILPS